MGLFLMLQVLGRFLEVSSDEAALTAALLPGKRPRSRPPCAPCAVLGAGGDGDGSAAGGTTDPGPREDAGGHGRCWERSSALPIPPEPAITGPMPYLPWHPEGRPRLGSGGHSQGHA